MSDLSAQLLTLGFVVANGLRLVSYWPQILVVAKDRNRATAISLWCWSCWVAANVFTGLYAWVQVGDLLLAVTSAFNAFCCIVVVILTVYKRLPRGAPS